MSKRQPMTLDKLEQLMPKMKLIRLDYRSGKRTADECIAELMAAPYHFSGPSSAMRFLDPGPPQADPPPEQ